MSYFKQGITILHELVEQAGIADALQGFATLALALGSTVRAVRLWACAEALFQETGTAMSLAARRRYDREVDSARARLSSDAFDQAWNEGHALTLDEAVRYALEDSSSSPGSTA